MLTITLLGTAATMPLPDRALTAALAECGGHALLFDCGEGTQAAARRAGVNLMKLDAICLTHYHGDHIFGLPGLLQTLGCQGRERPLTLYGPEGMGEIWPALRTLTGPLPYPVRAVQLDTGRCPDLLTSPLGANRKRSRISCLLRTRKSHLSAQNFLFSPDQLYQFCADWYILRQKQSIFSLFLLSPSSRRAWIEIMTSWGRSPFL